MLQTLRMLLQRSLLWITNTKFWEWLLTRVIPNIRFSTNYPELGGDKYHEGYAKLKTGHIILTVDTKKLTSLLIPGEFTHASLCVHKSDGASTHEIAEMTHNDYTKSYFFDLCKQSDRVVILECTDWDDEYVKEVVARCLSFENSHYNVTFRLGAKALYCSELIYQSDFEQRLDVEFEHLIGLGHMCLLPDGIYRGKNVRVVWDSQDSGCKTEED